MRAEFILFRSLLLIEKYRVNPTKIMYDFNRHFSFHVELTDKFNWQPVLTTPRDMVIFNSALQHYAHIDGNEKYERVSIACDMIKENYYA